MPRLGYLVYASSCSLVGLAGLLKLALWLVSRIAPPAALSSLLILAAFGPSGERARAGEVCVISSTVILGLV